jgi:Protein of unknown function (DUF3631)
VTADSLTGELLDDVVAFLRRYVVLSSEQATAIALWTVHSHAVNAIGITPYLAITSAEKGSGKTLLLEVLEQLVAKPWLTGSVSAATLARKIHQAQPTLLLDESDAAFKGDREYAETLRGVLNSGFKASGSYSRCVGANGTNLKVEDFKTFCAKAIAGLDQLPDTVADRSIRIRLKKKLASERVERKRERTIGDEATPLRDRIATWAETNDERLARLDLAPLAELDDRAADIWEPLLGVAYMAGERWFIRARTAAVALSARETVDNQSFGVCLLADIRAVFEENTLRRLSSKALADKLAEFEESPWAEFGKPPKAITPSGIARLLKRFEIRPRTVRLDDETTAKGYHRDQFEDLWLRYLPLPSVSSVTPSQPAPLSEKLASSCRHETPYVTAPESGANQHGLADVTAVTAADGGTRPLLGDELYPLMLAEAGRAGHITEDEFSELYAVHKLVERAREARTS